MWFFFQKSHRIGYNSRYISVIAIFRDIATVFTNASVNAIFSMATGFLTKFSPPKKDFSIKVRIPDF